MASPASYDVWFTAANTVYRGVPFAVLAGWAGQGRLGPADRIRPAGAEAWELAADVPLIADYLAGEPSPVVEDATAALEPVEFDAGWPKHFADEDDDVDMI